MSVAVEWLTYAGLFGAGCVAGAVNVVAGGGSFLTLPLLIFLGLPPSVANGTNRLAILLQNVSAAWGFQRHGVLQVRGSLGFVGPCALGGILGTWAALVISEAAFQRILALLMVSVTLWALWIPSRQASGQSFEPGTRSRVMLGIAFFLTGIYGGFVQAGVGFLILAATTSAGLDLVRGNALKVFTILVLTAVSLLLFAWQGKVQWGLGLTLAAGTMLGGLVGVRLTVLKGHAWVKGVVTVTVVLLAIKLMLGV